MTPELRYHLGDRPESPEAAIADWLAALIAAFFAARCWYRPSDKDQALHWARRLARLSATEAEIRAAMDWHDDHPTEQGRKVFARPDVLDRLCRRIEAERQRRSPAAAGDFGGPELAEREFRLWDEAAEEEREEARQRVLAGGVKDSDPKFSPLCRRALRLLREATTTPNPKGA
jgi:DNA-binding transcriptional MerR regulator